MITTLTILSLDQGKIYRPEPVPVEDIDLDAIAARHISKVGLPVIRAWPDPGRLNRVFRVSSGALEHLGGLLLRLCFRRRSVGEIGS